MDIDSLSRLIQAADVAVFRTLAADFLSFLGFSTASYCDGPYDGGKDFWLVAGKNGEIKCSIQLSVESKWQDKVKSDAAKVKEKYDTSVLYFLSSRRIPEDSFQKVSREIFEEYSISVTRYDSQAIATEFIRKNKVGDLLRIFGIKETVKPSSIKGYLGPRNEAIASVLIFGEESKELRGGLYDSLIKAHLVRFSTGVEREKLIDNVIEENQLSKNHRKTINSHIDHLLQKQDIKKVGSLLSLSQEEHDKFCGLIETSEYEASQLVSLVAKFFKENYPNISSKTEEHILQNILELTANLINDNFNPINGENKKRDTYNAINTLLVSEVGDQEASELFVHLAELISKTKFAKKITAAQLHISLLNTNSTQLIGALGGTESVNVYIDASVAIPLLCGVLFEPSQDRVGHSGKILYNLIKEHEFNAFIPNHYIEEMASHLIDACRDYKEILELKEDLSYSRNAFVSHYSNLIKSRQGNPITYEDYVDIFGIKINQIRADMSDGSYYTFRDRAKIVISNLCSRYGVETQHINEDHVSKEIKEFETILSEQNDYRPNVLIRHDACVVKYLSGTSVPAGYAKVLCTWDRIHSLFNQAGELGYFVLTPVAIIDLLSIGKKHENEYEITQLLDYAKFQNERQLNLSSFLWDELIKIEKGNFSDAELIIKAKKFKESYIKEYAFVETPDTKEIAKAWMAWKSKK